MKSANNEYYDSWLPIYINKNNFDYNKQTILNSFSVLIYGNSGKEEYDFKPKYIFEILFKLLNQMVINMKETKISNSYLRAFFQYILLYNKLSKLYPDDMKEYFMAYLFNIKDIYSAICNYIIFLLFDKFSLIEKQLIELKKQYSIKTFSLFDKIENFDLESPKEFIQYLEDNNLYNRLAKIMKSEKNMFLYNGKNLNKRIKQIICTSFKQFIYYSDKNTREKLKKLIVENINIYELIEFELNDESKKKVKNNLKSLFILLFIKKKINEKNFMNELENNFSVYLDIDETIEKLNEIKGNIDIFEDKEIGNNIKKHIKDLLILNYKIIETTNIKTKIKKDYDKCEHSNNNIYSSFGNMMYSIYLLNPFNHFDNFFANYINNNDFCFIEGSSLFAKLIKMKIDNIKLLFLYCKESLKKIINKKKNNFSLIELMFNEISLNNNIDNIDKNCEWYNFISEKQKYDKKSKKKLFNYIQFISEYKYFLKCFHKLIRLNEALLLRNRKFMNYMIIPELSKYIIEFSKLI